ncbi:MAG: hypothetical protein K2J38_06445, partial [Muribaculaceae bacterium]|nr:hypothetical protein [Muribaculaceae bacterium]
KAPAGPMPLAPEVPEEVGPRKSVPEHHAEESRQPQPADNEAPDSSLSDLRRAIVWGEILQPKFRQ